MTAEEQKKLSELGDKAPETGFRTRVLRGRNLRYAILDRADLRYADLTGANLSDASMIEVKLTRARLDSAKMQGARLDDAQMQGAWLFTAQMQGAWLFTAQMQGASLDLAQMQGASLDRAQMQGASLDLAQMQGASLHRAQLQGASLDGAQMQGVSLDGAQLQGATLLGVDGWRLHGLGTAINFARLGVRFEQRLMREQWESLVDKWLFLIPAGEKRDRARERLSVLLDTQDPAGAELIRLAWTNHSQPSDSDRINFLGNLACNPSGNPFIARGILLQVSYRYPRLIQPERRLLAARMLQDDCAGAKGLTAEERRQLAAIAAGSSPNQ